jgi:hypothetical protein
MLNRDSSDSQIMVDIEKSYTQENCIIYSSNSWTVLTVFVSVLEYSQKNASMRITKTS